MGAATFSINGSEIVTASDDGIAKLWDAATGVCTATLEPGCWIYSVCLSQDTKNALLASDDGAIVWDMDSGTRVCTFRHESSACLLADDPVRVAIFSPDATKILTASDDCTARLWAVKS